MKTPLTFDAALIKAFDEFHGPGEPFEIYFPDADTARASEAFTYLHGLYVDGTVAMYRVDDEDELKPIVTPCSLHFDEAVSAGLYRFVKK